MLAIRIFAGSMMSCKYCATSESLHMFYLVFAARRSCLLPAVLAMLGRGKRPNTAAKIIIYNVYQYFQETAKSKYRGALKLTSRTAETTWYSERMYKRRIVAEKTELDGAAFTPPPKRYRRERKRIDPDLFDTEAMPQV